MQTVHCAFWPSPPPLAAQPLIKQALSSSSTARQVSPLRGPPPQRGGGTPSTAESPLPNYRWRSSLVCVLWWNKETVHRDLILTLRFRLFITDKLSQIISIILWHSNTCCVLSYLQYESWERKDLEDVLAVRTVFLELQAPLLRTDFLRWFITAVVAPTLPAAHLLGADYGYDNVRTVILCICMWL